MSFVLPTGFDRADGKSSLPIQPSGSSGSNQTVGTATPTNGIVIQGAGGVPNLVLQENVDSPEIERAEQATCSHTVHDLSWSTAIQLLSQLGRGTFLRDSFGNLWRVLSSKIKSLRGDNAELTYVAESISFDTPPDDYQDIPQDLGIDIIKHPRYFPNLYPTGADYTDTPYPAPNNTVTRAMVKNAIIRAIQTYRDSPYFPPAGSTSLNGTVGSSVINAFITGIIPTITPTSAGSETAINITGDASSLLAVAAASEIINKLWFQLDTPYVSGRQVTWTQYFFQPVYLNPGGYIEDPTYWVPDYFMQPLSQNTLARGNLSSPYINSDTLPPVNGDAGSPGGATVFDYMAQVNPTCYSSNGNRSGSTQISWLRKADEVVFERTWFKVTHTWIGSPVGHWDYDIFSSGNRPIKVSDYNTTFPIFS